jgi:hypothetical protein
LRSTPYRNIQDVAEALHSVPAPRTP